MVYSIKIGIDIVPYTVKQSACAKMWTVLTNFEPTKKNSFTIVCCLIYYRPIILTH